MTERHYWKARLVKGGPFIGVATWHGAPVIGGDELDRHHRWQALVRNETTSRAILMGDEIPVEVDGVMLRNIEKITEAEYRYLVAHADYATRSAPHMPDASPENPIDWLQQKPAL